MSTVTITGNKRLTGTVSVSGAKNAALPILAATLMLEGESVIENVPNLTDVTTVIRLLRALGVRAEYCKNVVKVWNYSKIRHIAPYELITKMRASFFVAGPVLAKSGLAKIPMPGGCAIGARPIDIHLKGFEKLGAKVSQEHGFVVLEAKSLHGNNIHLDFPSVGATENIMMAACFAHGDTTIENAATEPEVVDLANFLNSAGANITGADSGTISIQGQRTLRGINYSIIPDRIEAGTLIIAAAIAGGEVLVDKINPAHIDAMLHKLREMGLEMEIRESGILVRSNKQLNAIDLETLPYPGFPTDMQAQFTSLLTLAKGTSVVTETIFENRFMYIPELIRMGAKIKVKGRSAIVEGVESLSGAPVQCSDLRAGAALWLAGLAAKGNTVIYGNGHVYRGYELFQEKLNNLGASIEKVL
ncbi:MAG: UDP-N-acetylglucosamine 1-carboxyvinyltransferase [Candidatus Margulisiibacteriota bacterium]|nr:MAG: UDP-N-acetylglucosamine 1-carboxyvinyltransferase [Candidatus Margulisbacteria bacterium GWD2_39_127]OGI04577.1 MAG: UDP-N-acetylglucosamine 1-carboxyvinyltransferase [Candidatus Margulisbacteria bacterium GWF2_38_17]OGI11891.1 MAG: UDP-N-acetylglucosamine 1-carboxyvinyltransferase [Candidatus Margulisbacteria bacterium GWE2_39_32]PZM83097.1 MAG: UDP-N-acetylglucosamine 1-carboxyvinyltransferase [Candidatus Margulisiibacteriota bacterium]HAR62236.1 UDP-N-acetylglucosamine 1-carboxyvinyl